jgi:cell wall-associated NlpC family hydrolase
MTPRDIIGKPYEWGARGPGSYDCWGVVLALVPQWAGVGPVDAMSHVAARVAILASLRGNDTTPRFRKVEGERQTGDIALLSNSQRPHHCGVFYDANGAMMMIHATDNAGVVAVPVSRLERTGWNILGVYRWGR